MTPTNLKKPSKFMIKITRRLRLSDLDWRLLLLFFPAFSLLLFIFLTSTSTTAATTTTSNHLNPFSYLATLLESHIYTRNPPTLPKPSLPFNKTERKLELDRSRIAVCLVGGARRFEITGPSIIKNILKVYPNADLFLHSPLDSDAYKLSLLKDAPKIASVRVLKPKQIPETESHHRVFTSIGSPNGIQGLLQYFSLVEGCIPMINFYQQMNHFTYDWVIRTRVDGYWSNPLDPDLFIPGHYLVPSESSYDGLNDRFGLGDLNSSKIALSRLSLIPYLDSIGLRQNNSESSFKAQLTTFGVPFITKRLPFCIMTDRIYKFPPGRYGTPVAAISSPGPLSGTKCRPCKPICKGACVRKVMNVVDRNWGWTYWANGSLQLCDANGEFENGWEEVFDLAAGEELAAARKRVSALKLEECVSDFEEMRKRTYVWDAPTSDEICSRGLTS